ncbi:MAG: hypothetical protein JWR55_2292 [Aeromicrobium sp.]|jgi:hypothetical protein|nr:hypothetical protein [Aeromicrobium sp.]
MSTDLHTGAPTVTLYGDRGELDSALSDELGRRGNTIHRITTPIGWLRSGTHAVIRIDTPAGEHALVQLASQDLPATHVVAVSETPLDDAESTRLGDLCRQCGDHHEVFLIWHPPFVIDVNEAMTLPGLRSVQSPGNLASTVADEVGVQAGRTSRPSFTSQVFAPHGEAPTAHG